MFTSWLTWLTQRHCFSAYTENPCIWCKPDAYYRFYSSSPFVRIQRQKNPVQSESISLTCILILYFHLPCLVVRWELYNFEWQASGIRPLKIHTQWLEILSLFKIETDTFSWSLCIWIFYLMTQRRPSPKTLCLENISVMDTGHVFL